MFTKNKKTYTRHRNRQRALIHAAQMRLLRGMVAFMMLMGGLVGGLYSVDPSNRLAVLAYATNVNHNGLLTSTNQQRAASGHLGLGLESRLNSAAQAKANHMVAHDYWSHTSPDGREPWDFIIAAGYSYNRAGENLAYGALTSEETVQAWMNSPGHRANILNAGFSQVGFGFANSPNYQGRGPQTVIVAMYAHPYSPPPPTPKPPRPKPQPAPVAPVEAATTKPDSPSPLSSQPAAKPPAEPAKSVPSTEKAAAEESDDDSSLVAATAIDDDGNASIAPIGQAQTVRRVSLVTGSYTVWAMLMVAIVGSVAGVIFLYRHSQAWHRWIVKGEKFIVNHPIVDAVAIMTVVVVVVLLQSVGQVL